MDKPFEAAFEFLLLCFDVFLLFSGLLAKHTFLIDAFINHFLIFLQFLHGILGFGLYLFERLVQVLAVLQFLGLLLKLADILLQVLAVLDALL